MYHTDEILFALLGIPFLLFSVYVFVLIPIMDWRRGRDNK